MTDTAAFICANKTCFLRGIDEIQAKLYSVKIQAKLCSVKIQAKLCSVKIQAKLYPVGGYHRYMYGCILLKGTI